MMTPVEAKDAMVDVDLRSSADGSESTTHRPVDAASRKVSTAMSDVLDMKLRRKVDCSKFIIGEKYSEGGVYEGKALVVDATWGAKSKRFFSRTMERSALVFGDVFNGLFAVYQTILVINSIAPIAYIKQHAFAFNLIGQICGGIAGFINLGQGMLEFSQAMTAFSKGNKEMGFRMLIDSVCMMAAGVLNILSFLGMFVLGLAKVTALLKAAPFLLPLIFFVGSILYIKETFERSYKGYKRTDAIAKYGLRDGIGSAEMNGLRDRFTKMNVNVELKNRTDELIRSINARFVANGIKEDNFNFTLYGDASPLLGRLTGAKKAVGCARDEVADRGWINKIRINRILDSIVEEIANMENLVGSGEEEVLKVLYSEILDELDSEMGLELSCKVFKQVQHEIAGNDDEADFLQDSRLDDKSPTAPMSIQEEAKDWTKVQYLRGAQQALGLIGFIGTVVSLSAFGINPNVTPMLGHVCDLISTVTAIFMNLVFALGWDLKRKYLANINVEVPSAFTVKDIKPITEPV